MAYQEAKLAATKFNSHFKASMAQWILFLGKVAPPTQVTAFESSTNLMINTALGLSVTKLMDEFSQALDPVIDDLNTFETFDALMRNPGSHRSGIDAETARRLRDVLAQPFIRTWWPMLSRKDKDTIHQDCTHLMLIASRLD